MAGYRETLHDETTFYVSPSIFKSEICKGFNRKSVINLLIKNGLLLLNNSGEYRQQKWTHDGNKKVYVVSGKILAWANAAGGYMSVFFSGYFGYLARIDVNYLFYKEKMHNQSEKQTGYK